MRVRFARRTFLPPAVALRFARRTFLLPTVALLLACAHAGPPAMTAAAPAPPALALADPTQLVGIVGGLELAGREDSLFGLHSPHLLSNLIVIDNTRRGRLFIHADTLPEVGGRRLQLGDVVACTAPNPASADLSHLANFRFLHPAGNPPGSRLLGAWYEFVPQYLKVMPPDFFPPVAARPGAPTVTATVAGLALAAREDTFVGGDATAENVILLAVNSPSGPPHTINTYSYALPAIGPRRIQLGDLLSFVPPVNDETDFDQLAGLRFRE
jgi:hypothetical protein